MAMDQPQATQHRSGTEARPINYVALTEVLLLGGTAALLLIKWGRGYLNFYIHPRYTLLIVVSGIVLLLMAGVRLRGVLGERPTAQLNWTYLLLALPLLLGTLVPAQPLDADTLAGRGLELSALPVAANSQALLTEERGDWNLLEWTTAIGILGEELHGTSIETIGFVFQDASLGTDRFYVARYVLTCCAADAAATGLPVAWEEGSTLPENTWVRVQGTLAITSQEGRLQPTIQAALVEPVPQPETPYLFP